MRLQAQDGDTAVISNVPLRLTAVQYSSDTRIKQNIADVDTDDLLQRIQKVEMKSYSYTDAWRRVRGIPDITVRGVIAQQLREVFPEHVQVLNQYSLPDKNFSLPGFHQVDKQGLVMDLIGAMQAHHRRFSVSARTSMRGADVRVSSADADDSSAAASSGAVQVATGTGASSGQVAITTGDAYQNQAGEIELKAGTSSADSGAALRLTAGDLSGAASGTAGAIDISSGHGPSSGDVSVRTGTAGSGTAGSPVVV